MSGLSTEDGLKMTRMAVEACTASLVLTGYVHADPHEGNLMLDERGRLVFLDFGLMSAVDPDIMEAFARGIQACLAEDYAGLAVCFRDVGFLTDPVEYRADPTAGHFEADVPETYRGHLADAGGDPNFPKFVAALGDAMETVEGGTSRFGALATVLNQVLAPQWKMFTPPYVLLLVRTFLTLEGIAAEVDPDFNIYEMALPWAVRRSLAPSSAEGVAALRAALLTDENHVQWDRFRDLVPTPSDEEHPPAPARSDSTEQAKREAMNDAVGSLLGSPRGAALRSVLKDLDLNDLVKNLVSRDARPIRRAAVATLGVKLSAAASDAKRRLLGRRTRSPVGPVVDAARPVSAEALKIRAREAKWATRATKLLVKKHLGRQLVSGWKGLFAFGGRLSWLALRISAGSLAHAITRTHPQPRATPRP